MAASRRLPTLNTRSFWCVNMVAVLFLACVLTQRLYSRFAEMPTQITIENQYEPGGNLPYPAITICSPNQITISFMKRLNQSIGDRAMKIDLEKALPDLLGLYEVLPRVNGSNLVSIQSILDLNNISVSELMGGIAQSCDSFLKLCYFEMKPYKNCETLFLPILTAYGLCCTFNSKYFFNGKRNKHIPDAKTRPVKTTGEGRGLIVVADYDPDDALKGTVLSGGAVEIMYTDSGEFPTDRESSLVDTDTETFHLLNAASTICSGDVRTLAPEDRKCYLDHEASLPYFHKYSRSDCDLMCIVQAVLDQCNCLLFYVPLVTTQHSCNVTSIPCVMMVKYYKKSLHSCNCLPDCESRQYAADVDLGNLNAMPYLLDNIYAGIKFNKSTLIMNFFFENSMYVRKKQETVMSLTILASNLGGVMGLCLGCSCISALEILFYLYVVARNYSRQRRQRTFVSHIAYKN